MSSPLCCARETSTRGPYAAPPEDLKSSVPAHQQHPLTATPKPRVMQGRWRRSAKPAHKCAHVRIRAPTSEYVHIRQHTCAYVSVRQHTCHSGGHRHRSLRPVSLTPNKRFLYTPAYVSNRQHTSACVSMRQHTSASKKASPAYVRTRHHTSAYGSLTRNKRLLDTRSLIKP